VTTVGVRILDQMAIHHAGAFIYMLYQINVLSFALKSHNDNSVSPESLSVGLVFHSNGPPITLAPCVNVLTT